MANTPNSAPNPKLRCEAEQQKWQLLFTLAGQGYNNLIGEFAEQLNMQIDAQPQPSAGANGEDKAATAPPPR